MIPSTKEVYEELWASNSFRRDKNRLNTHLDLFVGITTNSLISGLKNDLAPSVIDWGCGHGAKTVLLEHYGYSVVGCNDIAHNALDDEMKTRFPFFEAQPLHLASPQKATFSFCVDVLEHLPEEEIIPSLANIRKHTNNAAFFSIDCAESEWDGHILHETIRPPEYWFDLMLKHFGTALFLYTLPSRPTIGGLWIS